MTTILIRKPGRPAGSIGEKTKQQMLKARADDALLMLGRVADDPYSDPLVKIAAANVLLEHYRNFPSSRSGDC
jgi:hypothetical protein